MPNAEGREGEGSAKDTHRGCARWPRRRPRRKRRSLSSCGRTADSSFQLAETSAIGGRAGRRSGLTSRPSMCSVASGSVGHSDREATEKEEGGAGHAAGAARSQLVELRGQGRRRRRGGEGHVIRTESVAPAVLDVGWVVGLRIGKVAAELVVEGEEGHFAALEFLPRSMGSAGGSAQNRESELGH